MTPKASASPYLQALQNGTFKLPTIATTMQYTIHEVEAGRCRLSMPINPDYFNPAGSLQGGIMAVICDSAMGIAASTLLHPPQFILTVELKLSLMASPKEGELFAEGVVVRQGRRVIFTEATLTLADGTLAARASASQIVQERRAKNGE